MDIFALCVELEGNYTVKNIRRIWGRIPGNQLPGHVPLFFFYIFFRELIKIISHDRIGKSKIVLLMAA